MSTFKEFQAIVMEEFKLSEAIDKSFVKRGGGVGVSTASKDKSNPWDLHKKQSSQINKYGKDISDTIFTNQEYRSADVQSGFPRLYGVLVYLKGKGLNIDQAADVLTSYVNNNSKSSGLVKSYHCIFGGVAKDHADPEDVIRIYKSDKELKTEFDNA